MQNINSVLLYHVYLKNNWLQISGNLLNNVPHKDIYININVDLVSFWKVYVAIKFFKKNVKVKKIFITINRKNLGEVLGFEKLRNAVKYKGYDLLTYMHGKGVTRPTNPNISDWVELMRFHIIDRMEDCINAFDSGYKLYGVNLSENKNENKRSGPFKFSDFHFSGTFVSANLKLISEIFFSTPIDKDFYGIEGFWGKLCDLEEVSCPHISNVNHYKVKYPDSNYK